MNTVRIILILAALAFGARVAFATIELAQRVQVAQSKINH